ncbi:MAG: hypothetical protein ACOX4F_07285 [Atopobiaceae bacterium]
MSKAQKCPAICAGLVAATLAAPEHAQALGAIQNATDLMSSPVAYVALGALVGACVSGLVGAYLFYRERNEAEHELVLLRAEIARAEKSAQQARAQLAALGHEHGQKAASEPSRAHAVQETHKPGPVPASTPKVSRAVSASRPSAQSLDARLPRFPGMPASSAAPAYSVAAHTEPVVPQESARPSRSGHAPRAGEKNLAAEAPAAAEAKTPASTAVHSSYAERARRRSRGVRSLLSERMGSNFFMEGLPVIQRADGSVGDVGTKWWENTLSGSITHLGAASPEDSARLGMRPVDETSEVEVDRAFVARMKGPAYRKARAHELAEDLPGFGAASADVLSPAMPAAAGAQNVPGAGSSRPAGRHSASTERRNVFVPRKVQVASPVDAPAPEDVGRERAVAENDIFEQALNAMDDKMPNMSVRTSDENDTGVIPAAVASKLAGSVLAAEQKDASVSQHADQLVQEELERNVSERSDRRADSRRAGLRVLDGGTSDLSDARRSAYKPKHLKDPSKRRRA